MRKHDDWQNDRVQGRKVSRERGSRGRSSLIAGLRVAPSVRRRSRSLHSQIEELAAIEGIHVAEEPCTAAAAPIEQLPRAIDPLLGVGSGTVSVAICDEGTSLEPMSADVLSGGYRHEPTISPGRKVVNPHRPHVIRLPEQAKRSAGHVPARLRPVRDAGISCMSRADRMRERQRRRQRAFALLAVGVVAAILVAGLSWKSYSDRVAAETDLTQSGSPRSTSSAASMSSAFAGSLSSLDASDTPTGAGAPEAISAAQSAGVTPLAPTPIFAKYQDLAIYLPVSVTDLTEVGLHQANYKYTLQLTTHMPGVSVNDVAGTEGTKRDKALQKYGEGQLLIGSYIELWRSGRSTAQRTAADCGAAPGSLTYAPVTGVVSKVATYQLEGKATDYEVHITPDGYPSLEVVVIHISDVVVQEGDHVRGGATPIARVRDITGIVRSQLASYAPYAGNHTHIQLNDTTNPTYVARHSGQ